MTKARACVSVADRLDRASNKRDRRTAENDWFTRHAAEADIILDDDDMPANAGDEAASAEARAIARMNAELNDRLAALR